MPAPRRVVLDTNVVISALLSPYRAPAQVLDLVLGGTLTALVDDRMLTEYREVAARPRVGFAADEVARVLDAIEAFGEQVAAMPLDVALPDADDLPFVEVAVSGRADAVVTGNARHFVPTRGTIRVPIQSPCEFLDALRSRG